MKPNFLRTSDSNGMKESLRPNLDRRVLGFMRSVVVSKALRLSGLLIVMLLVSGCGESGPELGTVTGTVKLDGMTVEGAVVQFVPLGGTGTPSYGLTNAEGIYEMEFSSSSNGVMLGNNMVRISSNDTVVIDGKSYSGKEVFPKTYNNFSEVEAEVVAGANVHDFDCESDESTRRLMKRKGRGEMAF